MANSTKKRMSPLRFVKKYGRLIFGGAILAVVIFCAVFAPLLTDYDPVKVNMVDAKQTASADHIMGTDNFGRDIFARLC